MIWGLSLGLQEPQFSCLCDGTTASGPVLSAPLTTPWRVWASLSHLQKPCTGVFSIEGRLGVPGRSLGAVVNPQHHCVYTLLAGVVTFDPSNPGGLLGFRSPQACGFRPTWAVAGER